MPNFRDIRRRIRSVKSTQQITKAMKMVSTAKLRRAQDRMNAARPYAQKMREVLSSLAARVPEGEHPLLAQRDPKTVMVAVVTADRGLCGAFNTNILRAATDFLREREADGVALSVVPVGRKGRDFFRRRRYPRPAEWAGIFRGVRHEDAEAVTSLLLGAFTEGKADAIYLIYNEFKSMIQQRVVVQRLLPVEPLALEGPSPPPDYLREPGDEELLETLLPRYVSFQVYHALLESEAAEQAARMTSMESATNNANEMIDALTLYANRVRQAAITKEIIEVVSGAQSMG